MVAPGPGSVVLVTFPFSDLSSSKLRPAVVLADAGRDDWILCQVTSNPYADPDAVRLDEADYERGSLRRASFARPAKLFTANRDLMVGEPGMLAGEKHREIVDAVVALLRRADRAKRMVATGKLPDVAPVEGDER